MNYKNEINTVIFDLGGVLVDWDPKYVYNEVFNGDNDKVNWFLNNVCTAEWNLEQDSGRTITEGNALLINKFPEHEDLIKLFYEAWPKMFKGIIEENVTLFKKLIASENYKIYALTNWSSEKWEKALELFPFFKDFDGVVVSGIEKVRKPHIQIYKTLFERFNITPEKAIFIDDNLENISAAINLKLNTIHFSKDKDLSKELKKLKIHI